MLDERSINSNLVSSGIRYFHRGYYFPVANRINSEVVLGSLLTATKPAFLAQLSRSLLLLNSLLRPSVAASMERLLVLRAR